MLGCSTYWYFFLAGTNYCSGTTYVPCWDNRTGRVNCGYPHPNINISMKCRGYDNDQCPYLPVENTGGTIGGPIGTFLGLFSNKFI